MKYGLPGIIQFHSVDCGLCVCAGGYPSKAPLPTGRSAIALLPLAVGT